MTSPDLTVVVWGATESEASLHRDEAVHCLQIKLSQVVMLVGTPHESWVFRFKGCKPFGYIPAWMYHLLGIPKSYGK